MITIIAGSRNINSYSTLCKAIELSEFKISCVISGCAEGIDNLAIIWAYVNKVKCKKCPADWKLYGKSAGFIRNNQMAKKADSLIAVWDSKSPGTKHMIDIATTRKLNVYVFNTKLNKYVKRQNKQLTLM